MITHSELLSWLRYDPETGAWCWLKKPTRGWRRHENPCAVCKVYGYNTICVQGERYRANRLAWFYMTGEWPAGQVDHENRNRADDRWGNLRDATHAQNQMNSKTPKNNTSGIKGVSWHKATRSWRASISVDGRTRHLGHSCCKAEAACLYAVAANTYFGEFDSHGTR